VLSYQVKSRSCIATIILPLAPITTMANDTIQSVTRDPLLNESDARALDAMLEQGGPRAADGTPLLRLVSSQANAAGAPDAEAGAEASPELKGWLATIGKAGTVPIPRELASRTLARVLHARAQHAASVEELEGMSFGGGIRWPELAAAIAIVLTGVLLALPALDHARANARQAACADNLAVSGQGLSRYATDNKGSLPRLATAPGSVWWNVGKAAQGQPPKESNSAHLYNLVRSGHLPASRLNCPDNATAVRRLAPDAYDWPNASAVSYSYQNQFAPRVPTLERNAHNALLADKNPLFAGVTGTGTSTLASYNPGIPNDSPSYFHSHRGQNILMSHGAVTWQKTPVLSTGDNIWVTNRPHASYTGTETNTDPNDSFLVP